MTTYKSDSIHKSTFSCECLVNSRIPVSLFTKLESRLRKYLHAKPLTGATTTVDLDGDEVLAATIESLSIVEEAEMAGDVTNDNNLTASSDLDVVIEDAAPLQGTDSSENETKHTHHQVIKVFLYKYPEEAEETTASSSRTLNPQPESSEFYSLETFPNCTHVGLWESLQFDSSVKSLMLSYVTAIFKFSLCGLGGVKDISFNRILLLHGPPGTGKTTLARALVFKLSTRLHALQQQKSSSIEAVHSSYDRIQCITVQSNQLFSRWFSESGKSVQKLFEAIKQLAQVSGNFVCVLIDEVESLAMSRKQSADSGSSEPTDSIRTVNTLLTQIDETRKYSNIVYLATSNFPDLIDSAFLDRVDWSFPVSLPSKKVIYSLLLAGIKAMRSKGLLKGSEELATSPQSAQLIGGVSKDLLNLAHQLQGQSGRAIKRLPLMAYATFLNKYPGSSSMSISIFIDALKELITVDHY